MTEQIPLGPDESEVAALVPRDAFVYDSDPVAFLKDILGIELPEWQRVVLRNPPRLRFMLDGPISFADFFPRIPSPGRSSGRRSYHTNSNTRERGGTMTEQIPLGPDESELAAAVQEFERRRDMAPIDLLRRVYPILTRRIRQRAIEERDRRIAVEMDHKERTRPTRRKRETPPSSEGGE